MLQGTLVYDFKEVVRMRAAIVAVIALALLASGTALARISDKVHSAIPEELKNNPPRGTYWDEELGVFVLDPPIRIEPPQSMLLNGDEDMIYFDDEFMYNIVANDFSANSALTKFPMPEDPCEGGAWVLTSVLLACYNRDLVTGEAPDPLDLMVYSHGSGCTNFGENPYGDELVVELARAHYDPDPFLGDFGPIAKWQQVDFEYPVAITSDEFWVVWKHTALNPKNPASYYVLGGYAEGLEPEDYDRFFENYDTCPTILLGWGPWTMRAVGHCSETPVVEGKIDIKPTSCPNPINPVDIGVISVAILGTDELDVMDVDPSTVVLRGEPPLRYAYDDVGTPYGGDLCGCHTLGADGYEDLVFKFDSRRVYATLGQVTDNEEIIVPVTWELYDGTLMQGADCFIVRLQNNEESNAGGDSDCARCCWQEGRDSRGRGARCRELLCGVAHEFACWDLLLLPRGWRFACHNPDGAGEVGNTEVLGFAGAGFSPPLTTPPE
jgi:hypothetical protein